VFYRRFGEAFYIHLLGRLWMTGVVQFLPEDGIFPSPFSYRPNMGSSRPPKQCVSVWWLKQPDRHAYHSVPCYAELCMLSDIALLSHAKFFSAYLSILIRLHGFVLNKTLLYA